MLQCQVRRVTAPGDRAVRLPIRETLYERLWRGGLPEADHLPQDLLETFFAAYLRTYLERDVRLLLQVDDWQQFGRFVQMVAALTAQEVNYSQLGREIGMTPLAAKAQLHHWRSHGGAEVDIILERDGILYPIEIKTKTRPSRNDSVLRRRVFFNGR